MNKRYLFILLFSILFMSNQLKAQQYIEANYYSDNYSSPGMSLIYGYTYKSYIKEKEERTVFKTFSVGLKISFYNRNNNHTAYISSPFIRYQKTFNSGILIEPELGLGYMFKKNNIPTFEYFDNEVKELTNAGHHRFLPSLGLGIGYSFNKKINLPMQVHFRPGLSIETPNNTSSLIHFQSEIGVTYLFGKK